MLPRPADHIQRYIAAASINEQKMTEKEGSGQTLLDAGVIPLPAACEEGRDRTGQARDCQGRYIVAV